ncbi:MAG TPA: iron transporter [Rubrobacteraceae bacterium]|nr:iron transporter [Rubrobacteraceae bacterium]
MRTSFIIAVASLGLILAAAGCGNAPVTNERAAQETTGETTGSSGAASASLRGVVDSYKLAHEEIEAEGGEKDAGGYEIGYIVEPAEGWWEGDPGDLTWRGPRGGETNHIEILPFDAETGLLVPQASIKLDVYDESGKEIQSKQLEFYYSEFYHYANNFSLPKSGKYTLEAEISPPDFRRHGEENGEGKVFTEPVTVKFENVEISTKEE